MHIYSTERADLVAGLTWEFSYVGGFRPAQLGTRAAKLKATHYVQHVGLQPSKETAYGFVALKGKASKKASRKKAGTSSAAKPQLSLASLVARRREDSFIFLAPASDSRIYFLLVLSGQPMRELLLASEADVIAEVERSLSDNAIAALCVSPELGYLDFGFEGLDYVELNVQPSAEELRMCALKVAPRGQLSLGMLVLILVSLGGLGGGGALWYHHKKQLEEEQAQAQQLTPAQVYQQNKAAALSSLPLLRADQLGQALAPAFLQLPTQVASWSLQSVRCVAQGAQTACEASWSPLLDSATYQQFQDHWKGESHFDTSLHQVVTVLSLPKARIDKVRLESSDIPGLQPYLNKDGSFFQAISPLHVKVNLGKPALVGGPPTPVVPGMVASGTWVIKGPLYVLTKLFASLPPNMALAQIDVHVATPDGKSLKDGPQFQVNGVFYVQPK